MLKAPCKDCPDRYLGCHGTCEKYREYKERHAEEAAANQQQKDAYKDLCSYKEAKVRRLKN